MFDKEPEDIFSGTEPAKIEPLRPGGAMSPTVPGRPGAPAQVGAMAEDLGEAPAPRKKMFLIIMVVMLAVILGAGGYLAWQQFMVPKSGQQATPSPAGQNANLPAEAPANVPANIPAVNTTPAPLCGNGICETGEDATTCLGDCPAPPPPAVGPDTDGDGLTDAEEATLGTDPTKADTDADGLTDREEVVIYKTDPLNPDTDGDGYKDGDEVKAGYNPNGPGKLFELPQ
jgi:hypothetical protein